MSFIECYSPTKLWFIDFKATRKDYLPEFAILTITDQYLSTYPILQYHHIWNMYKKSSVHKLHFLDCKIRNIAQKHRANQAIFQDIYTTFLCLKILRHMELQEEFWSHFKGPVSVHGKYIILETLCHLWRWHLGFLFASRHLLAFYNICFLLVSLIEYKCILKRKFYYINIASFI